VLAGYDANGERLKGSQASVNVLAGQDSHATAFSQKKSGFGLFATGGGVDLYRSSQVALTTAESRNVASSLMAGGNLNVGATRDITIEGSIVTAKGQTTIDAKRDVAILPGSDASSFAFARKDQGRRRLGLGRQWRLYGVGGLSCRKPLCRRERDARRALAHPWRHRRDRHRGTPRHDRGRADHLAGADRHRC